MPLNEFDVPKDTWCWDSCSGMEISFVGLAANDDKALRVIKTTDRSDSLEIAHIYEVKLQKIFVLTIIYLYLLNLRLRKNLTMKKLLLLASAAVFVYAAFTQFRPEANDDGTGVETSAPVSMDLPLSMTVNGEAYASNLPDIYYESYMRSVATDQKVILAE